MVYWTEEDFKEIYGRYQESGLSIREFCNREGILEGRLMKLEMDFYDLFWYLSIFVVILCIAYYKLNELVCDKLKTD